MEDFGIFIYQLHYSFSNIKKKKVAALILPNTNIYVLISSEDFKNLLRQNIWVVDVATRKHWLILFEDIIQKRLLF